MAEVGEGGGGGVGGVGFGEREIGVGPEGEEVVVEVDLGEESEGGVCGGGHGGSGGASVEIVDGEVGRAGEESEEDFGGFEVVGCEVEGGGGGLGGDLDEVVDDLFLAVGFVVDDAGSFFGAEEAGGIGAGGGAVVFAENGAVVGDELFGVDRRGAEAREPEGAGAVVGDGVAVFGGVIEIKAVPALKTAERAVGVKEAVEADHLGAGGRERQCDHAAHGLVNVQMNDAGEGEKIGKLLEKSRLEEGRWLPRRRVEFLGEFGKFV